MASTQGDALGLASGSTQPDDVRALLTRLSLTFSKLVVLIIFGIFGFTALWSIIGW